MVNFRSTRIHFNSLSDYAESLKFISFALFCQHTEKRDNIGLHAFIRYLRNAHLKPSETRPRCLIWDPQTSSKYTAEGAQWSTQRLWTTVRRSKTLLQRRDPSAPNTFMLKNKWSEAMNLLITTHILVGYLERVAHS